MLRERRAGEYLSSAVTHPKIEMRRKGTFGRDIMMAEMMMTKMKMKPMMKISLKNKLI